MDKKPLTSVTLPVDTGCNGGHLFRVKVAIKVAVGDWSG